MKVQTGFTITLRTSNNINDKKNSKKNLKSFLNIGSTRICNVVNKKGCHDIKIEMMVFIPHLLRIAKYPHVLY